jgi:hypothetical protein
MRAGDFVTVPNLVIAENALSPSVIILDSVRCEEPSAMLSGNSVALIADKLAWFVNPGVLNQFRSGSDIGFTNDEASAHRFVIELLRIGYLWYGEVGHWLLMGSLRLASLSLHAAKFVASTTLAARFSFARVVLDNSANVAPRVYLNPKRHLCRRDVAPAKTSWRWTVCQAASTGANATVVAQRPRATSRDCVRHNWRGRSIQSISAGVI